LRSKNCKNYLAHSLSEEELIKRCKRKDRAAQKLLFDKYSAKMFGVCKRYVKNQEDAEDVLVEGLFKVLTKIDKYSNKGSFEGWIRRILVNESLMHLRKRHNFKLTVEVSNIDIKSRANVEDDLAAQDILNLLDLLPTGYRTVFNMYVIEGYKHKDIAEILGVSINTSKSQLLLARRRLQSLIKTNQLPDVG
jgi:RNA polymerase sigma factor (sigma-70 family)